jgi:hypothetical protein
MGSNPFAGFQQVNPWQSVNAGMEGLGNSLLKMRMLKQQEERWAQQLAMEKEQEARQQTLFDQQQAQLSQNNLRQQFVEQNPQIKPGWDLQGPTLGEIQYNTGNNYPDAPIPLMSPLEGIPSSVPGGSPLPPTPVQTRAQLEFEQRKAEQLANEQIRRKEVAQGIDPKKIYSQVGNEPSIETPGIPPSESEYEQRWLRSNPGKTHFDYLKLKNESTKSQSDKFGPMFSELAFLRGYDLTKADEAVKFKNFIATEEGSKAYDEMAKKRNPMIQVRSDMAKAISSRGTMVFDPGLGKQRFATYMELAENQSLLPSSGVEKAAGKSGSLNNIAYDLELIKKHASTIANERVKIAAALTAVEKDPSITEDILAGLAYKNMSPDALEATQALIRLPEAILANKGLLGNVSTASDIRAQKLFVQGPGRGAVLSGSADSIGQITDSFINSLKMALKPHVGIIEQYNYPVPELLKGELIPLGGGKHKLGEIKKYPNGNIGIWDGKGFALTGGNK